MYRKHLMRNMTEDSTWFYLNKQAAFASVITLCDEADESSLGPITVVLRSKNIEDVIDWLGNLLQGFKFLSHSLKLPRFFPIYQPTHTNTQFV